MYNGHSIMTIPTLSFETPEFVVFAEIGILFLLFISGLEISFRKLKKTEKASTFVAIGGVIAPLTLGFLAGLLLGFSAQESIAIGLILTATSVGVTVRTLMDLGLLDTDVGATILGGAIIDDIIAIILLVFVMGVETYTIYEAIPTLTWISVKIAIFFLIFLYLGLKVIDKILKLGEKIHLPKAFLSISLSILLIYSFFAYEAGISGIIGAFIAGILIGQNVKSRKIHDDVRAIGYGFFIPLFFTSVGATLWKNWIVDLSSLTSLIIISISIIIIGIIGKILGCGIGAKVAGMSWRGSLQIGIGMIPRMELALIISAAVISHGIFTSNVHIQQILFSTILLTIVTTLLTPFLIKATFKNKK